MCFLIDFGAKMLGFGRPKKSVCDHESRPCTGSISGGLLPARNLLAKDIDGRTIYVGTLDG